MRISDWSSDVCSSDLLDVVEIDQPVLVAEQTKVSPALTCLGFRCFALRRLLWPTAVLRPRRMLPGLHFVQYLPSYFPRSRHLRCRFGHLRQPPGKPP